MRLKVLSSGSSGNCYILESDTEALIIEAGVPFKEVKVALGFNVRKIVGMVVSHSHGDHSKYATEYEKAGIPIFKPYECETINRVTANLTETYANFSITEIGLVHDVLCYGFYINHPEIGNLVYASDTEYIKYRFKNLNHILVEANHSIDLVDRNAAKYEHQIRGHMSIETTCNFLEANKNPLLLNVVLCHLSQDSADEKLFLDKAKDVVDCNVYIASKGLEIPLNLYPF